MGKRYEINAGGALIGPIDDAIENPTWAPQYVVTGNAGKLACWRTKADISWNPTVGYTSRETWVGSPKPILLLYQTLAVSGYRVQVSTQGPLYTLTVDMGALPGDGSGEVPVDHWTIDWERAQISIWREPGVYSALMLAASNDDTQAAKIKKSIIDSVNKGLTKPPETVTNQSLYAAWLALLRGQTSYEVKRPVLGRQRTFSLNYVGRMQVDQIEKVYSNTALISNFNVPTVIQGQLPNLGALPTPPTRTVWAWKVGTLRTDEIPALYKVQEQMDWILAAWSQDFYQYVP